MCGWSDRFPAMARRACRRSQVAVELWETPTGAPPTIYIERGLISEGGANGGDN